MIGDGLAEPKRGAGEDEQCQRMSDPPGQTMFDDVGDIGPARGDAGDRREVVDLERVLHTQKKSKPQNSKHVQPASPLRPDRSHTSRRLETARSEYICRFDLRFT